MAQGAAMAIEDAAVLATVIAGESSVPNALAKYEQLRRARTRRVQRGSRRNAQVFHADGVKAWARNRVMGIASARQARRLFQYDALSAGLPAVWAR
jgi:salicylate hydroxylase